MIHIVAQNLSVGFKLRWWSRLKNKTAHLGAKNNVLIADRSKTSQCTHGIKFFSDGANTCQVVKIFGGV